MEAYVPPAGMPVKGIPCKHKRTYRISPVFCANPAIFGRGQWYLAGLKKYLPDVFVCHIEELQQHLVLGRVKLPQVTSPDLAGKNPAEEHHLNHISKGDVLFLSCS